MTTHSTILAYTSALFFAVNAATAAEPTVISGAGHIIPLIEQYRALIGDNHGSKPAQSKGRREISWDGISDDKAAPAFLPADIFKVRGADAETDPSA